MNYPFGHWMNGRASARSLGSVVGEICERSGVTDYDVSDLHGVVRGYSVTSISGARAALQPLMLAYGFEAAEREGKLIFASRDGRTDHVLDTEALAITGEQDVTLSLSRAPTADMAGRVRLNYVEAEGDYEVRSSEAIFPPDEVSRAVSQSEFPLVLLQSEGQAITERWLAEARVARDSASFALPPSATGMMAGDVVEIETDAGTEIYRLDHVEQSGVAMVNAVRIEPGGLYEPSDAIELMVRPKPFVPAVPAFPLFMDLPPLITGGDEVEHAPPHLGVVSQPWPGGSIALYSAGQDAGYELNTLLTTNATMGGVTETTLFAARHGLVDHGSALRVRMSNGTLDSASLTQVLNGANLAAIGDGTAENWEIFQFTDATLVEEGVYDLTGRLRGQLGSDAVMPDQWPVGSYVVLLNNAVGQIQLNANERGLARHYRVGPSGRSYDDPVYQHRIEAFNGIGLRPYAPVHLEAVANGGDLDVSWIRRTRSEGDSWQNARCRWAKAPKATWCGCWMVKACCVRKRWPRPPGPTPPPRRARTGGGGGHVQHRRGAGVGPLWPPRSVPPPFGGGGLTMRPMGGHGDISAAGCALLSVAPPAARSELLNRMLTEAEAADAYRRDTGRVHPLWGGNGSLMSAALVRPRRREPFLDDPDYAACLAMIFDAVLERVGG